MKSCSDCLKYFMYLHINNVLKSCLWNTVFWKTFRLCRPAGFISLAAYISG